MEHCKKCSELRRKIQKLESQLLKAEKQLSKTVTTWDSPERKAEAVKRDKEMAAVEKANSRETLTNQKGIKMVKLNPWIGSPISDNVKQGWIKEAISGFFSDNVPHNSENTYRVSRTLSGDSAIEINGYWSSFRNEWIFQVYEYKIMKTSEILSLHEILEKTNDQSS